MNSVIMIGNLAGDPELRKTGNGFSVCRFRLAVQRDYIQNGQRETDFFQCVTWNKMAEHCAHYLKKGSKCAVKGSMETRSYENQNGEKRYTTELVADKVQFLTPNNAKQTESEHHDDGFIQEVDDEMPF